ncbi:MAG: asparagine synthase (glutamine-hydrolyzing) [Planctomycetia bacterium]|nr:asparagine synthase (glutamine-hydrolyzing) [Planctomycetia bacterium]
MCGIAGIVSLGERPIVPDALERMGRILAHRGPDDAGYTLFRCGAGGRPEGGYWSQFSDREFRHRNEHLPVWGDAYFRDDVSRMDFHVGLAHRRLAIQDLSHYGHQPMPSSDQRLWVTYNGEIYNYPELRDELAARGHVFRTRSDTEALLHGWDAWETASLKRLNGMFAFALFDRLQNELYLARDRFGVKPLYYAVTPDYLLFASEIKSILASRLLPAKINPDSLTEYFTFQNAYSSATLFEGVHLLPPGEFLRICPQRRDVPSSRPYCDPFPSAEPALADAADLPERVADCFQKAVRRQLIGDVEVGSYLSGGMDSGSIVAVAGKSIPRLYTFTCGFDLTNVNGIEQGFDERDDAERLAYLLQTEHYDVVLHAGDMAAAMERITWHVDDLRVGMCHQNWYAAKLASRFVKVCLAGAGGDELFGGYPWRYVPAVQAPDLESCDRALFRFWHRLLSPEALPALFSPDLRPHLPTAWQRFKQVLGDAPAWRQDMGREDNLLQRALAFEFRTFMRGYLIIEDRMSMAHSLESRVPFLDNDLADLAWRIPPSMKIEMAALAGDAAARKQPVLGKLVLRRAMEKFLPPEFTRQRKTGFSPPDENWYRGPSLDYIKTILLDPRTRSRPWFEPAFVEQIIQQHVAGEHNHRLLIWSLMSFEWLQRHFIDQQV